MYCLISSFVSLYISFICYKKFGSYFNNIFSKITVHVTLAFDLWIIFMKFLNI